LEIFSYFFENIPVSAVFRQKFKMYKYAGGGGGLLLEKKKGFIEIFSNFSEI